MPQFQIRRHPYGHTFEVFHLNSGKPTSAYHEGQDVQECLAFIRLYMAKNCTPSQQKFYLTVLPD